MGTARTFSKGFTIIEVLIVLAIASLMIMMVFFAVPTLQRNHRNTERKQFLAQVGSMMEEFRNNHRSYPTPANIATLRADVQTLRPDYDIFINTAGYSKNCDAYFVNQSATNRIAITYPGAQTSGTSYILAIRLEGGATACTGNI